ncbi:MAG: protein jag [Treponema sp.]|jgi:spoIIIJ-associated protein|nr:protein jag [Treponema sp.]
MVYEFEGRTEKEAIDKAAIELGLGKSNFDVEIIETQRPFFLKKGYVKIRVHVNQQEEKPLEVVESTFKPTEITGEFEQQLINFLENIIKLMGYSGKVIVFFHEEHKIGLRIDTEFSSELIGKKGKTLDALQLLMNIYAGHQERGYIRIILDCENYRIQREELLVQLAHSTADKVRKSHSSILLEPMNPFDRRIIHTVINEIMGVETRSEGEGFYRQVRVYYKGRLRTSKLQPDINKG